MAEAPSTLADLSVRDRLALNLQTSGPIYVSGEDSLQIAVWNSLAGVRVTMSGRFIPIDGIPRMVSHTITPTSDRAISTGASPLGEGWLVNLTALASAGAPITGQTFARVQLVRGSGAAALPVATLAAGYITAVQPVVFPGSGVKGTLDGPGAIRSISGTNPGAGVEVSESVPVGARWRLLSMLFTLVTDGTVANRFPRITFDDGATVFFVSSADRAQTAGNTYVYVGGPIGFTYQNAQDHNWQGTPMETTLLAGHRIRTSTTGLQAGDNYGPPQLLVEEWIEGAA